MRTIRSTSSTSRARRSRGAVMIEAAITMPVFLVLVFGVIDILRGTSTGVARNGQAFIRDIGEHRGRSKSDHSVRRRDPRHSRGHDLVAGTDSQ